MTDHYQILGIHEKATVAEIKTAYRKLALQYHPDRNDAADAVLMFNKVQKAYDVLCDPQLRRQFDLKRALEKSMPSFADDLADLRRTYSYKRIDIRVSRTIVKVGQPFSVILRCPKSMDSLSLPGLEHFQISQSLEHELWLDGGTVTEVHYVLRAIEEGELILGPVHAESGGLAYTSDEVLIRSYGQYKKPKASIVHQIVKTFTFLMICSGLLLIMYNINKYGANRNPMQMLRYAQPIAFSQLKNGSMPYPDLHWEDKFQDSSYSRIRLMNYRQSDAVAILIDQRTDKPVTAVYVQSKSAWSINDIVPGRYTMLVLSGYNWADQQPLHMYGQKGSFRIGPYYTYIGSTSQNIVVQQRKEGDATFYTVAGIDLYPVRPGYETFKLNTKTSYFR